MACDDYDPDDPDAPQDIDLDADPDETEETRACPACGGLVHWDADHCHHCGHWISRSAAGSAAHRRSQTWFWPVAVAVLVAVILVLWHGLRG